MHIKNHSLVKELQKTGLSDKESLVYTALLELGGAYPSKVAEYSGLKRATTYNVLMTLSVRGMINEIEKKNKLFSHIDKPSKLVNYSSTRVKLAEDGLERAKKILPDIEGLFSLIGEKPRVLYFEGDDTVLSICNDMVSGDGNYEMLSFSNASTFKNLLTKEQLRKFIQEKERLNIKTRGIVPDTTKDRSYNVDVFSGIKNELWPVMKYMPEKDFPYEAEITIYSTNKVSITKLGGPNVIGVIIEDKIIHDMMRMIFELSWGSSTLID